MRRYESLATYQRRLLAAVKDSGSRDVLFPARELAVLRETVQLRQRLGISQSCRFTTTLLATPGRLDEILAAFVRDTRGSDSLAASR